MGWGAAAELRLLPGAHRQRVSSARVYELTRRRIKSLAIDADARHERWPGGQGRVRLRRGRGPGGDARAEADGSILRWPEEAVFLESTRNASGGLPGCGDGSAASFTPPATSTPRAALAPPFSRPTSLCCGSCFVSDTGCKTLTSFLGRAAGGPVGRWWASRRPEGPPRSFSVRDQTMITRPSVRRRAVLPNGTTLTFSSAARPPPLLPRRRRSAPSSAPHHHRRIAAPHGRAGASWRRRAAGAISPPPPKVAPPSLTSPRRPPSQRRRRRHQCAEWMPLSTRTRARAHAPTRQRPYAALAAS